MLQEQSYYNTIQTTLLTSFNCTVQLAKWSNWAHQIIVLAGEVDAILGFYIKYIVAGMQHDSVFLEKTYMYIDDGRVSSTGGVGGSFPPPNPPT